VSALATELRLGVGEERMEARPSDRVVLAAEPSVGVKPNRRPPDQGEPPGAAAGLSPRFGARGSLPGPPRCLTPF